MSLLADPKAAIKVVDDVRALQSRLERAIDTLDDVSHRLTILEQREDLLVEKAKNAAQMAAASAAQRMNESVLERLIRLETRLETMDKRLPPPEE